jgi:hypothetical protein
MEARMIQSRRQNGKGIPGGNETGLFTNILS